MTVETAERVVTVSRTLADLGAISIVAPPEQFAALDALLRAVAGRDGIGPVILLDSTLSLEDWRHAQIQAANHLLGLTPEPQ